jgi:branched-chain amino acid transport system substrate-binding protein
MATAEKRQIEQPHACFKGEIMITVRIKRRSRAAISQKSTKKAVSLGTALAVAGGILAACSGSKSGTQGADSTNQSGNTAKGSPISIGTITTLSGANSHASIPPGIKSAIANINAQGGINGHPLKAVICDEQNNPSTAAQCARTMVSAHVVYVFGNALTGDAFVPILKQANIPYFPVFPVTPSELTSSNSFSLGGGVLVDGATVATCAKLGSHKIGIAIVDVPSVVAQVKSIIAQLLPQFGVTAANTSTTLVPVTAVDMSTYAAAVMKNSDCIAMIVTVPQQLLLAKAIHSQNPDIPAVAVAGTVTPAQWKTIGSSANNVFDVGPFPPASVSSAPGIAEFNAEMNAYDKNAAKDAQAVAANASVHLAAKFLTPLQKYTSAALLQALNSAGPVTLPPLPPLNFQKPAPLPGITRIFTQDFVFWHYLSGGTVVPFYNGDYVDVSKLSAAPALAGVKHVG